MDLRDASITPEPARDAAQWRVPSARAWLRLVAAALFVLAGLFFGGGDPVALGAAGLAAVVLGALAVRDLLAPVRLAADRDGVTVVVGFAGHRRLPWSQVHRVRVDARQRFGARTEMVEIDAGESLHLFSPQELGAPAAEVVDELAVLRGAPAG